MIGSGVFEEWKGELPGARWNIVRLRHAGRLIRTIFRCLVMRAM
jgi:hypothetical protein